MTTTTLPSSAVSPVLSLENVSFAYPGHEPIFESLSLAVRPGERVALMGGSGTGKTTLLKLIAGLKQYQPASGVCRRSGSAVMVFQQPLLLSYMTVEQNILLPMKVAGQAIDIDHVVETLELRPLLKRYPYEISGGQQRRVSLARSLLAPQAGCLILDEAFTGLDEPLKERILEQLSNYLCETRLPCLFATHSTAEAVYLATRILFLGGKPCSLIAEHEVALPHMRDASLREADEYFAEIKEVRHLVHRNFSK